MSADRQPLDAFAARLSRRVRASIHHGAESTHEARTRALEEAFGADLDGLRAEAARSKQEVLARLDHYLERAATQMRAHGVTVHFARDAEAARAIAKDVLRSVGARRVVKSKSMLTEEIELNPALEAAGFEVVETDLGELIVQLDEDRPSHIVKPILHKSRGQIAATFERAGLGSYDEDPETITRRARRHLRRAFLSADVGITGANFVSAESGRLVVVTNEGNARFCLAAPGVHVAFVGIEKLVPRDADLAVFLELLARSGTGQRLTVYTQLLRGPTLDGRPDGPREVHVVFVDNGRRAVRDSDLREVLGCIRCGACLNVCPVYRQAGGHGYRSVYPGPIGSVLTPLLEGAGYADLPKACSTCGACGEVCPVQIPLPDMLLRLRDRGHREAPELADRGTPSFSVFATAATQPLLWRAGLAVAGMGVALPQLGSRMLPGAAAWTEAREVPRWRGGRFRLWMRGRAGPRAEHPELARTTVAAPGAPAPATRARLRPRDLPEALDWSVFRARLEAVNGVLLEGVRGLGAALRREGLRRGYVDPALWAREDLRAELEGFDVCTAFERPRVEDYDFGITNAEAAIAETGSVVLSDASVPARLAAVAPWAHVALVPEAALLPDLPAALAALGDDPSVIWVTGPSKTADVEGILIEGAHGPGVQIVCRI